MIIRTKTLLLKRYTTENVIKIINELYKNTNGVSVMYSHALTAECLEIASMAKLIRQASRAWNSSESRFIH